MNQQNEISRSQQKPVRKGRWIALGVSAALVGVLSVAGVSYANDGDHHRPWGRHGAPDAASMAQHIDKMVDHVLTDGTPEQKAKLSAIAKAAFADLKPLHEQHDAGRQLAIKLLTQPVIDRAALEQVRVDEMRLAEQASKRIVLAMGDAADVLTPDQSLKFAAHLEKRMHH
jgi:periplasmic protein CpxP/Spy